MSEQGPTVYNGRYELHRRLGRGGMAEVYLARDQLLDRPVAVKVLFPEFATDVSFVERFRREAQSAANLSHPNIVGVYDWGEANGTYYIVMEYVDGRTLAEILRDEGTLHPDRAADITADVAAALGSAHRNGVVHRDVKPANVLVTPAGQVKVADFGIARAISATTEENLTQAGTVMGTATYFSPEQARGDAVDPRSDIYSLGCVLYELVTGRPPFQGGSPITIAYKHVQESPVPPRQVDPGIPVAMEAIVLKTLAKNPVNRYPSAEDLRADLRRFREGNRILAEPVMGPLGDPGATGVLPAATATEAAVAAAYREHEGTAVVEAYEEPEEKKSSAAFLVVLVLLLAALAGLLFVLARMLGVGEDGGPDVPQVVVPSVVGSNVDDAEALLVAEGFEVDREFEANDDFEENVVFDQEPGGGERVDEGSTITLFVSSGANAVPVPSVIDQPVDDARRFLEGEGFSVGDIIDQPDEDVPAGIVIDQDPAPDELRPRGTAITLIVSSGPAPRTVPQVGGLTVAEASQQLGAAGFTVGQTNESSSSVDEGLVIRTEPAAGEELPRGERVTIVVSTGPARAAVPSVVGLSEANAINQIESNGFVAAVEEDEVLDPNQNGRVIAQNPPANGQADLGTTVRITVGRFVGTTTTTSTTEAEASDGDSDGD